MTDAQPSPDDLNSRGPEPEVQWLNAQEQLVWRALAAVIITLPAALDSALHAQAGISHFDYMVLSALSEREAFTMRMSELAAFTTASLSRLSHVVSRLERRGWIVRAPSPEDGRYTNATLTEAGFNKVVASAPGHVATVRAMVIDALSADQLKTLHVVAGAILSHVVGDTRPWESTP